MATQLAMCTAPAPAVLTRQDDAVHSGMDASEWGLFASRLEYGSLLSVGRADPGTEYRITVSLGRQCRAWLPRKTLWSGLDVKERQWVWADLRRPVIAGTAVVVFVLTLPLAVVGSCNTHELGHAVAGSAVGWEIDRVVPCLPSGGHVRYRASNAAGDAVESWAGGLVGAFSLLLIYGLISRRGRCMRSPLWWVCGLGLTLPIGIQLAIAGLEGTADFGDDYTDTIAARPGLFLPALLLSALAGPAVHTWWWVRRRE